MDALTKQRKQGGFTRMLIQTGIQEAPKQVVHYRVEDGCMMDQKVEYGWLPVRCGGCAGYVHTKEICKKRVQRRV